MLEGEKAVVDAIEAGTQIYDVFTTDPTVEVIGSARSAGARIYEVSDQVLRAVSDAATPQAVVATAELRLRSLKDIDESSGLVLVLAQVRDPGNAGTLVRSAAATGCGGVVFTHGSVDPFGPKTLRAGAGAMFRLPVITGVALPETLQHLRERGFAVVGADARAETSIYEVDLTQPTVIVLGNESWGLPEADSIELDMGARIPMPGGVESLNVGVAGSLLLFEVVRQRQSKVTK